MVMYLLNTIASLFDVHCFFLFAFNEKKKKTWSSLKYYHSWSY